MEEYAWVDKLLEQQYNMYSLTKENIDDFIQAGLLNNECLEKESNVSASTTTYSSSSNSNSNITNPFCNIEVEQNIFNNYDICLEINGNEDNSSIISSISSTSTTYDLNDAYDSDEYYIRVSRNSLYCFH